MTQLKNEQKKIKERIAQITSKSVNGNVRIVTKCLDYMDIYRGHVYKMEDKYFLIRGEMYEPRFGIMDHPKFWVKKAIDLDTGRETILKFIFNEEFIASIGPLRIRCYRDPEKETDVLNLVKNDMRFMQGTALKDGGGDYVRVIDFIKGKSLYASVIENKLKHEEYYNKVVPWLLQRVVSSFEAIKFLHENNFCHGDIRSDHIIIERNTNEFRWIDFDLRQNFLDFDLWSLGNVLNFILGKGIRTFHELYSTNRFSESIKNSFTQDDVSAFFTYRIMNLQKLFPYVSNKLNAILMHFTLNTINFYEKIDDFIYELNEAVSELPKVNEEVI